MSIFNLPASTIVNRIIPKNSFDRFTTSKQKKSFSDLVDKIRWANKLSRETINLSGSDIKEIQVFEVSLKKKTAIPDLLNVIDRSIPYPIIFILACNETFMVVASAKHPHPTNENTAVIDWTFTSPWAKKIPFQLNLKQSLDSVWTDFCKQLSGRPSDKLSLAELIAKEHKINELKTGIEDLRTAIKKTRQFNKKVELNIELQKKLTALEKYS
ncbi:MAG: DUF4391 domain-containing protein [Bacteroidetes bacterium]|nr:DUF4391 domain-containing protein [Bacteroidota bacterium]